MRAVVGRDFSGIDGLRFEEVPRARLGPDMVRMRSMR